MSRRQKDPLRTLSAEERALGALEPVARRAGGAGGAGHGVAGGRRRAELHGRGATGRTPRRRHRGGWVARFNREGLAAVVPRHGGGPPIRYADGAAAHPGRGRAGAGPRRVTARRRGRWARCGPPCAGPGTVCPPSAPTRSGARCTRPGLSWQKSRTWCDTGVVARRRGRGGAVTVTDPDAAAKKS